MNFSQPPSSVVAALADASDEQLVAVMEVMHCVAKADGFLSADELRQFLKFAKTVSQGRIDSSQLSAHVSDWSKRPHVDLSARLLELNSVLESTAIRQAAYDLALRMAAADGTLHENESAVLEAIEITLGVSQVRLEQ